MAKRKPQQNATDGVETIETALTSTEQFIERNRKWLLIALLVIVLGVTAYLLYRNFYKAPRENEAMAQVFYAEQQFEKDSFALALNGDGNNLGFLQVMDEYSGTKTANLCRYYSGICYREMGDFDNAIKQLEDYSLSDEMIAPLALGSIGDCYIEKQDTEKGYKYYQKAVVYRENSLTTPYYLMKIALIQEEKGDWAAAYSTYEEIKNNYPNCMQARDIERYMARAQAAMDR